MTTRPLCTCGDPTPGHDAGCPVGDVLARRQLDALRHAQDGRRHLSVAILGLREAAESFASYPEGRALSILLRELERSATDVAEAIASGRV